MPLRRVVDTSWLYALFDAGDAQHASAVKDAERPGRYEVPSEVLAETLSLRYSRASDEKATAARTLLASIHRAEFHIQGTIDPAPALLLYSGRRSLSYVDCIAITHAAGAELLTFDDRQARVWRQIQKGRSARPDPSP